MADLLHQKVRKLHLPLFQRPIYLPHAHHLPSNYCPLWPSSSRNLPHFFCVFHPGFGLVQPVAASRRALDLGNGDHRKAINGRVWGKLCHQQHPSFTRSQIPRLTSRPQPPKLLTPADAC